MITNIKLKNFRNFESLNLNFQQWINQIVWDNWKWKTNILEAIWLLTWNTIFNISFTDLVKNDSDFFYISSEINNQELALFFDKIKNKKTYSANKKNTTKKRFEIESDKSVIFSPLFMNIMYFSPSHRRDYIDSIISQVYPEYKQVLKKYNDIVKNRNKVLKAINEWKSTKTEITYYNRQFITLSIEIYKNRTQLIDFLKNNINNLSEYFIWKDLNINFSYESKIDLKNIEEEIKNYLIKEFDKDIIIQKTRIWPHCDDFDIKVNDTSIKNFASRWELKSILIWLKFLEIQYIEKITNLKPILLIDDLFSELDIKHEKIILEHIKNYQTIISNIEEIKLNNVNIINL